jgi:hypothetical protein
LGTFPFGTFTATSGGSLSVTMLVDISQQASARNVILSVEDQNSITALNDYYSVPVTVGISSQGDPTGFPMSSNLLLILPANVASTYGNYPNPFRPGTENTTIEFYLASATTVSLVIYDALGERVVTLADGRACPVGLQHLAWDGKNAKGMSVVNGVYYAQLDVNGNKQMIKIAVVK